MTTDVADVKFNQWHNTTVQEQGQENTVSRTQELEYNASGKDMALGREKHKPLKHSIEGGVRCVNSSMNKGRSPSVHIFFEKEAMPGTVRVA